MSASLLVELFTEELPPKALRRLGESFGEAIASGLAASRLAEKNAARTVYATPRRLAVKIANVLDRAPDRAETKKLMPAKVAFGADGKSSAALAKRLEKEGGSEHQLERKIEGGTEYVFLNQTIAGITLAAGLQIALRDAIAKLPIAKVMSYQLADGATTVQFVRPAHGLVALHGADIVPVSVLGLAAGRVTHGHRFQGVKDISIATADAYAEALAAHGNVVASFDERHADIARQLAERAAALKASLGADTDYAPLLEEVTALVEHPAVYAGEFDAEFLAVPPECLVLTMRQNQKYFPLFDAAGKLISKFLIVSNMRLADPKNIVEGNQRVVRPRLADARFFFETDKKIRLEDRVPLLAKVVYHNKLGSQLDRVGRVRKIAATIAQKIGADAKLADRAALLAKADLATNMVGEFPELQGIMGRYYALADGEDARVADAIQQHYRPRFAGDKLPEDEIAAAVALADKLETLAGLFGIGQLPTGDKDPFALRRHGLGVIRMLCELKIGIDLATLCQTAIDVFPSALLLDSLEGIPLRVKLIWFLEERAASYLREKGYSAQEVESLFSLAGLPSVTLLPNQYISRIEAVRKAQSMFPEEFSALANADKRARNILRKSGGESEVQKTDENRLIETAEKALLTKTRELRSQVDELTIAGKFDQALLITVQISKPVTDFFDSVMVNSEDQDVRVNRFRLLHEVTGLTNRVADISKLAT